MVTLNFLLKEEIVMSRNVGQLVQYDLVDVQMQIKMAEQKMGIAAQELIPDELEKFITAKRLEGLSERTLKHYRFRLMELFKYVSKPLRVIYVDDIRDFMTYKSNTLCDRSLENIRNVFNSFFTWCTIEEYITTNPMLKISKVKFMTTKKEYLSEEELEVVRKYCRNARDRAIVEFLYSTGCRASEALGLTVDDVDLKSRRAYIVSGKGKKSRWVYLNAKSVIALRDYLNFRKDNRRELFVSLKKPYKPLTVDGLEDSLSRLGRRCEPQIALHPHIFRHTMATQAVAHGMPIQEVSTVLGHSRLDTTMVYVTMNNDVIAFHHQKYVV